MGCGASENTESAGQSTAEQGPEKETIQELKKVPEHKPCFGHFFAEEELYKGDPLLYDSDEVKQAVQKWDTMSSGAESKEEALDRYYAENPEEFLKCLKEGPPPKYRWLAWKTALHINQAVSENIYSKLITLETKVNSKHFTQIKAAAQKTFAYYFSPHQAEHQRALAEKLENALVAVSVHCGDIFHPEMASIAGFLLMVSDLREEEVFWAIVQGKLPQDPLGPCQIIDFLVHNSSKPELLYSSFKHLFEEQQEKIKQHFEEVKVKDEQWVEKWFREMFLGSFSFGYCLRFWDYMLSYGISGVRRLMLGVVECTKKSFEGNSFMECSAVLNSFSDGENLPTPDTIIEAAERMEVDLNKGAVISKRVTYEVDQETGMMEGVEDEPRIGKLDYVECTETASRAKLT
eukprot:TRINITY_DN2107_c0_g1_i4.p1 TRINITY_DN2107_c0_g1~~TRINITY_DN2107_c0_g1_i4.p1  ORF type:complete len:404 (-),score=109.20 TRINITY_DN2107_c0_g1_i4:150-1361(-)